jgi:OOP family OmpA-OmpF porin
MRKTVCFLAFFVPVLLTPPSASAQQPKVYLGAGGGSSSVSFNSSDFDLGIPQTTEKSSTAFKVFGGVRFNDYFALELGYVDLGKFKVKYNGGGAGTAELDYQVSGIAVSGIGSLPVTQDFSLFGRVGAFASTAKLSLANASGALAANLAAAGITAGSSDTANATTLLYGAGVQYDFTKNVSARVEYENFGEVGNQNDTGRATVSLISASLLYRF